VTGPDDLRSRFAKHTAAALVTEDGLACGPAPARWWATPPHRAAGAGTARGVPRRPARPPRCAHRPLVAGHAAGLLAPSLGVLAVAAAVFCMLFCCVVDHVYLHSVSAAGPVQIPFSLLFFRTNKLLRERLFSYMSTPQTSWSGAA